MTDDELVARAHAGDADARRTLVERASLRTARAILGDKPADRIAALRELASSSAYSSSSPGSPGFPGSPAPALGPLLAAIGAFDPDGELRRAAELVYRASASHWGPPEREAIGRFAARHGARLGPEHALELLEWAARNPGDLTSFVRATAAALADVPTDAWPQLAWRTGFEHFTTHDRELTPRLAAAPTSARAVARALLSAHAREQRSCVPTLEAIWAATPRRDVWAAALGEATSQNRGMSGRAEVAAWGWRRFCDHPADRRELYTAFSPWLDDWLELRNATPADRRPGGASAVAHLRLWGGLDVERLSASVDEATRLARDADWPELVDAAFDLAEAAPHAQRLYALAGACRLAHEVTNRVRDPDTLSAGLATAADRLTARARALASHLRDSGAVLDQIVANRAEDLDTCLRLITEAHERRAAAVAYEAERAERARRAAAAAAEAEAARRAAEAEAARRAAEAEAARRAAAADLRNALAPLGPASLSTLPTPFAPTSPTATAPATPSIELEPIDREIFFPSLPAPSLLDYARLFKRLTSGDPDAVQSLAASGVPLEMIAVVNQTWSTLFASRVDLAIRFSKLIAATWS